MRRGSLSFDQALAIQVEAESLLAGAEYEVDTRSVMLLVKDSDCSACDCECVTLARQLDASLVTTDGKLLRAFPEIARALDAAR